MDSRQLKLDCDQDSNDRWRVYCLNSRVVLSEDRPTPEDAWSDAACKLAEMISEIRRAASL